LPEVDHESVEESHVDIVTGIGHAPIHAEPFHVNPDEHLYLHSVVLPVVLYADVVVGTQALPLQFCVMLETVFQSVFAGFALHA